MRSGLLTVLSLFLFLNAAQAEDKPGNLDGKWKVAKVERDGKPEPRLLGAVRENAGNTYTLTPAKGESVAGTFSVDTTTTPHTMDMKPGQGRYKGKTLLGVYELKGDTLTICFAEPGQDRPADFASKAGRTVVVHQRVKE